MAAIVPAVVVFLTPGPAAAAIYMWQDANGVMHFTDHPKNAQFKSYVPAGLSGRNPDRTWGRQEIVQEIRRIAPKHGMDPRLVEKVVWAESDFDPFAVSHMGAMGLMQLMPTTAQMLGVAEPFDPVQNLDGGIRYLRYLLDRFRGKLDWALAAYHAGENRVERHRGIPPIPATRQYVERILKAYAQ